MSGSKTVIANLYNWANLKRAGLTGLGLNTASNMQNYARTHRRWKDQTGNARAGLHGGSFWQNPFVLLIYIAHAVEYGIYLELAHDRKNQILEEARNKYSDKFLENAKRIMGA
ncbi:MAG: hypothetical protein PHS34_08055 [Candidatus Omnitrophica bacterium]|nr:hypothetical protein [Candidatus Omnitrophota bacterium]